MYPGRPWCCLMLGLFIHRASRSGVGTFAMKAEPRSTALLDARFGGVAASVEFAIPLGVPVTLAAVALHQIYEGVLL